MVLHILHTGVLKEFLQFIPSPIVGVKLLQGEGDSFGGLLGAHHPQSGLWLETYKGAPIHSHIEEDAGFGALSLLLGRELAAQGASDCERNYGGGGKGGGSVLCLLEKVPGVGDVHRRQGGHERKKEGVLTGKLDCWSLSKKDPGAMKRETMRERSREVMWKGAGGFPDKKSMEYLRGVGAVRELWVGPSTWMRTGPSMRERRWQSSH